MDVVAKQHPRVVVVAQQWCAGKTDLDGVGVRLAQVGKETALGVVAAVYFIEKVHALDGDVVVIGRNDIRVVLEFLDVDHGDFRFARMVVDHLGCLDGTGKGFARIDGVNRQAARDEFPLCLLQ
ncbi:hypothetical protein D9M69_457680 [compost metagenome]